MAAGLLGCSSGASSGASFADASRGLASALPKTLPRSRGHVFYVSRRGNDRGPGTRRRPWRTIERALNTLKPGDKALVRAGIYRENILMSHAGSASKPITLAAYPHERAVLRAASAASDGVNWYPVQITGSYFRLRGFLIENGLGTSDANVYLWGGAHQVELSNNEIRYGQDQGILTDTTTSHIYILGNRIHDNGWHHLSGQHQSHGIYLEGGNDLVANNVIYNHPYGFGVQVYPDNHDTIVTDNTIAASGHSSIVVGGPGGVSNITIRNNILYDGQWGVEMDSTCPTGPVTIDHNVIYAYAAAAVDGACSRVDTRGGNLRANPRFVDYARRDLHLGRFSPAIRAGLAAWSVRTDADGQTRPRRAPAVGAFER